MNLKKYQINKLNNIKYPDFSVTLKTIATSVISMPIVAYADDGAQNAFLLPLAVSIFTMVPFLYYQQ
jgi:hypothetical protein